MKEYTKEELEGMKKDIDRMGQVDMARSLRFSDSGHPFFRADLPLYDHFSARFASLGGMTPEISKLIGW